MRTHSIFDKANQIVYDIFVPCNDAKLQDYNLFANLWRETLLMHSIRDPRVAPVVDFGQLPKGIIFR